MARSTRDVVTRQRLEELCRELGTLLMAFAPLDFALAGVEPAEWWRALLFLAFGASLFIMAVWPSAGGVVVINAVVAFGGLALIGAAAMVAHWWLGRAERHSGAAPGEHRTR